MFYNTLEREISFPILPDDRSCSCSQEREYGGRLHSEGMTMQRKHPQPRSEFSMQREHVISAREAEDNLLASCAAAAQGLIEVARDMLSLRLAKQPA
ncbi:MAG: hypothetical protein ACO1N5_08225 [Noviherbaspirillum sp.]